MSGTNDADVVIEEAPAEAPATPSLDGCLLGNLIHRGKIVPAGQPIPDDLDAAQLERLQRIGVIA